MEEDYLKIKKLLFDYIKLILDNYSNCDRKRILNIINNQSEIVKYNTSNTITFIVQDNILLLPMAAYQVFSSLKEYENYGINKNNYRKVEDYLDTNTTYQDYIVHVIEAGLSVYDYFEESLLHEAMHICGSQGGTPLEEGINELKTRELAQEKNIRIAAYGYSKEVALALRLQQVIGKQVMDELTFIPRYKREEFLINRLGEEIAELYFLVSDKMIEESKQFYSNNSSVSNPFEKAQLYDEFDYIESNCILDSYLNTHNR